MADAKMNNWVPVGTTAARRAGKALQVRLALSTILLGGLTAMSFAQAKNESVAIFTRLTELEKTYSQRLENDTNYTYPQKKFISNASAIIGVAKAFRRARPNDKLEEILRNADRINDIDRRTGGDGDIIDRNLRDLISLARDVTNERNNKNSNTASIGLVRGAMTDVLANISTSGFAPAAELYTWTIVTDHVSKGGIDQVNDEIIRGWAQQTFRADGQPYEIPALAKKIDAIFSPTRRTLFGDGENLNVGDLATAIPFVRKPFQQIADMRKRNQLPSISDEHGLRL